MGSADKYMKELDRPWETKSEAGLNYLKGMQSRTARRAFLREKRLKAKSAKVMDNQGAVFGVPGFHLRRVGAGP